MKKLTIYLISLMAITLISANSFAQSDINGKVLYHNKANKPIPAVHLNLIDASGVVVDTTTTLMNGSYSFTNVPYGTYKITASTSIEAGGVTMGDALLMLMHLCNIYSFNPLQALAADVDGDGAITWDDFSTVVIGWFIQGYPFPAGPWIFQDVVFEHTGAKTNVPTMGGSSSGDVNGTFVPATRNLAAIQAIYTEQPVESTFNIEIFAKDVTEVSAMGMVIDFPASMVTINNIHSQVGELNTSVENGQIRLNWIDHSGAMKSLDPNSPVLVINASTNSSYDGSDIRFVINPESHICDFKGEQIDTRYTLPLITMQGSYLASNYPNPFNGYTNITYTIPSDSKVNISLFNQQGQLVKVITDADKSAGTYNINFNSDGLEAGVYYYTLKASGNKTINETKRMIITR